jgi:hypothetical protein
MFETEYVLTSCWVSVGNCCLRQLFSYITTRTSYFSMRWRCFLCFCFLLYTGIYIYIYLKNDIGVHIFYIIKLYISWRQATLDGIRNRNTVYIKFAKNNVREIDWNYLILTINKRLFTMKIENHDTTKLGSKHEHLLKREIQRMWTNIKA